jgi:hypothetical protein
MPRTGPGLALISTATAVLRAPGSPGRRAQVFWALKRATKFALRPDAPFKRVQPRGDTRGDSTKGKHLMPSVRYTAEQIIGKLR